MRDLLGIGIGAGNPAHVTVQAVEALNRADVFFVVARALDAGIERTKGELRENRGWIMDTYLLRGRSDSDQDRSRSTE